MRKRDRLPEGVMFFSFVLAGLTGVLFRLGMTVPLPEWLSLQNIRHAHSHLMFFGWAAPLPLWLMGRKFGRETAGRPAALRWMRGAVAGGLAAGLLSWPFFLVWGYRPVPVGGGLPLSVILSGLVMVSWYVYMAAYIKLRKSLRSDFATACFEAALLMLFVCSLGAWGVAAVQAAGAASPLPGKALTHFFLAAFTEGWVVLSVTAILADAVDMRERDFRYSLALPVGMIVLGAPLTFAYGITEELLSPLTLLVARAGGVLSGLGVLALGWSLWKHASGPRGGSLLRWPLGLLMAKGLMQAAASLMPSSFLFSSHSLRIFYLHVLLLGGFTLGGLAWMHLRGKARPSPYHAMVFSVGAVLASLLLLTPLLPPAWGGIWIYPVLAGAAALPVLAMGAEWRELAGAANRNLRNREQTGD